MTDRISHEEARVIIRDNWERQSPKDGLLKLSRYVEQQQEADTVSRAEHERVVVELEHARSDTRSLLNARNDLEGQRDALKARVEELEAELRIAWEEEPSEKAGELPPLPQTSPFPQVAQATAHVAIPALPIDAEDERVVDEIMPRREARPLVPQPELCSCGNPPHYPRPCEPAPPQPEQEPDQVDKPPGSRLVPVYLSEVGDSLSIPGGAFTTIRACRHCGVLITGGPTACVHCVRLADELEQRGRR